MLRNPELTPEQVARGIARVKGLEGKPYDWDLVPGNDSYYCSEVVTEFFRAADSEHAPRIGGRPEKSYGAIMNRDAIVDPLDILESPDLRVVVANEPAKRHFPLRLQTP